MWGTDWRAVAGRCLMCSHGAWGRRCGSAEMHGLHEDAGGWGWEIE